MDFGRIRSAAHERSEKDRGLGQNADQKFTAIIPLFASKRCTQVLQLIPNYKPYSVHVLTFEMPMGLIRDAITFVKLGAAVSWPGLGGRGHCPPSPTLP